MNVWEFKAQTRRICPGKEKCVSIMKGKGGEVDRIGNVQGEMRLNREGIRREQA